MARIYGERDLLVAECLRLDVWAKVDAPTLAAIVAALIYEARRDDEDIAPRTPRGEFVDAMDATLQVWDEIEYLAKRRKLGQTTPPDLAFSLAIHRWASGARLDAVLADGAMLPGDFIRWTKQIVDLLDQIAQVGEGRIETVAREAIDKVKRGIVAYSYYG